MHGKTQVIGASLRFHFSCEVTAMRLIMKKVFLILGLFFPMVSFACSQDLITGAWEVKFQNQEPYQIGVCRVNIDELGYVSGECDNWTTGNSFAVFDGRIKVKNNCKVRGFLITSGGQRSILFGKYKERTGMVKGTMTTHANGITAYGRFRMY